MWLFYAQSCAHSGPGKKCVKKGLTLYFYCPIPTAHIVKDNSQKIHPFYTYNIIDKRDTITKVKQMHGSNRSFNSS